MLLRYRLAVGVAAVSLCGIELRADEDGVIEVPEGSPPEVPRTLEDPAHFGLTRLPDEEEEPETAAGPLDPLVERKRIRDVLRHLGIKHDGRGTLPYLRECLDKVREGAAEAVAFAEAHLLARAAENTVAGAGAGAVTTSGAAHVTLGGAAETRGADGLIQGEPLKLTDAERAALPPLNPLPEGEGADMVQGEGTATGELTPEQRAIAADNSEAVKQPGVEGAEGNAGSAEQSA